MPKSKIFIQPIPVPSEVEQPVAASSPKPPSSEVSNPIIQTYLTVAEVARELNLSRYTVTRRFQNLPGVWDAAQTEGRNRRRYRELRIPRSAVVKFVNARRVGIAR